VKHGWGLQIPKLARKLDETRATRHTGSEPGRGGCANANAIRLYCRGAVHLNMVWEMAAIGYVLNDWVRSNSKYPPAKPEALEHWPLKAADGVADAAPGLGGH
jgi:hypothetical protein